MAPEQAMNSRSADHRADIYSLGCVLYKMLTGRAVYPEKSPLRIVQAHCNAPIPSLCQVRPDVPVALDRAFQKMLAKTPEQRFQSMNEVIAAL
jgi:serine/threonine protein kinase